MSLLSRGCAVSAPVPCLRSARGLPHQRSALLPPCSGEVALYQHAYAHRLPLILKGADRLRQDTLRGYMAWTLGRPLVTLACNEGT